MDASAYIVQLPAELQEQIRTEVTAALAAAGSLTEDHLNRAMDGRIGDLEEVLDVRKYTDAGDTPVLIPGYQAPDL